MPTRRCESGYAKLQKIK